MADQRTMEELLRAPTEGYAEEIVVPPIPAEHFELKHSLINLVTSKQLFGFEKEDPHAHVRYFNKITSTLKYKDVPETSIKLILFLFSIDGPARIWLDKDPPRSILTWDDLVSKFINHFFPPSKMINLWNEILNFHQKFEETFSEAWDRFKDLLQACPHHGFTKLHQLDTFYNGLNPFDQDSLNFAASGNLLERSAQDIANAVASAVTSAMTAMFKQHQVTPTSASVKAVEESCVTCGGAHSYRQCLATDGNTFLGYQENIQGYVLAAAANDAVMKNMQIQMTSLTNSNIDLKNMFGQFMKMNTASTSGSGSLPRNTVANLRGNLKAITTRSGISYDGPPIPPPSSSLPKVVEREPEETKDTVQPSTKNIQPPVVQIQAPINEPVVSPKPKPSIPYPLRANKQKLYEKDDKLASKFVEIFRELHFELSFADALLHMPKFASMFKSLLNNKEKLFDLSKTPLVECLALADLGASINLMPLSIWKKLSLPELTPTQMILELADRSTTSPSVDDEAITFKVGQTSRYSYNDVVSINRIDVIDVACEEYAQEVLGFSDSSTSGNPTPSLDHILSTSSPSLTPFEEGDFILEEIEVCLTNDSIPPGIDDEDFDLEGDLLLL
ncbi:reverse transcriptase domain-containing protein [Tanacetum coccineum]